MEKDFKTQIQIKFQHADPAGIMYFAHIFSFAHDCFEEFVQAAGFSWGSFFQNKENLVPIKQTECRFEKPFLAGETYSVTVAVASFSTTSFVMHYEFKKGRDVHAVVKMVHTCLDPKTYKKTEIPLSLKTKLEPFLKVEHV